MLMRGIFGTIREVPESADDFRFLEYCKRSSWRVFLSVTGVDLNKGV